MLSWPWSSKRRRAPRSSSQPPDLSSASKVLRESVNTLVESLPGLLKALDEVTGLHPFIGIAVGAFRVAVELDVKRGGNDEKIGILFVEIRDTMEVLLQLRGIKNEGSIGPDGLTIKARMRELVKQTAEDIKSCANACDTYAKRKLIVKVINASGWEGTFKGFIHLFASRRKAFIIALVIHVDVDVDANQKLKDIDAKVAMVLDFLSNAVSHNQRELTALVDRRGGPAAAVVDDNVLEELLNSWPAIEMDQATRGNDGAEDTRYHDGDDLKFLKQELLESPELAIRRNLEIFERKFKMQQRELLHEIPRGTLHESGRIMGHNASKPHDRIIDPDIREIWREMQWPGHAEARHFVLALHDYYSQQTDMQHKVTCGDADTNWMADEDEWALEWINSTRLQSIMEAFDDDGSGFITIAEVNYFTSSRPKEWSLPHWLAYWAIGWQMTATKYRDMIVEIFTQMFAIRSRIHPANRNAVDTYLQTVWQKISTLTLSFVSSNQPDSLQERFKSYVEAEEERLRQGLETVRYDIDAMDTLLLVTGPGRIDKHLFPLLWLLLRRDFEIFRLCRHTVIHKDELWDSADTILWVLDAVTERHNDMEALFKLRNLEPGPQFKVFASELYDYWHDFDNFWRLENQQERIFEEVEYDDSKENQKIDISKLLNYPLTAENLYPLREDPITDNDAAAVEAVRLVLGRWNGVQVLENEAIFSMPITFYFHASEDHRTYEASAITANGTDYNIHGNYTTRDNSTVEYSFVQTYAARIPKTFWTGTLAGDGETLSGRWGYKKEDQPYTFIYKRSPFEVLVDRPLPEEFAQDKVKALWKYALTAVRNQVRRGLFSWSYLKARRDLRKEYVELLLKEAPGWQIKEEVDRSSVLAHLSTFEDVRCFYVLREYRRRAVQPHFGISCDNCDNLIYGTRVVCMECGSRFTFDFCDKPACVDCTVQTRDDISSPHLPTHDFVKIRAPILHYREIGKVLRNAKSGLERARDLLEKTKNQKRGSLAVLSTRSLVGKEEGGEKGGEGTKVALVRRLKEATALSDSGEVATLTCLRCESLISRPCLYCIDCPEDDRAFICWDCDEREAGFSHGTHHLATHNLVRCMKTQEEEEVKSEDDDAEKRVDTLEHTPLRRTPSPVLSEATSQGPKLLRNSEISWKWNPYHKSGRSMTDPGYGMESMFRSYRSRPADATTSSIEEQD